MLVCHNTRVAKVAALFTLQLRGWGTRETGISYYAVDARVGHR